MIVEAASHRARIERRDLRDVLVKDPAVTKHLSPQDLEGLFDPQQYLGKAIRLIKSVLGADASRPDEIGRPFRVTRCP